MKLISRTYEDVYRVEASTTYQRHQMLRGEIEDIPHIASYQESLNDKEDISVSFTLMEMGSRPSFHNVISFNRTHGLFHQRITNMFSDDGKRLISSVYDNSHEGVFSVVFDKNERVKYYEDTSGNWYDADVIDADCVVWDYTKSLSLLNKYRDYSMGLVMAENRNYLQSNLTRYKMARERRFYDSFNNPLKENFYF